MHLILLTPVFPDPCARTITFEHSGSVACLNALCSTLKNSISNFFFSFSSICFICIKRSIRNNWFSSDPFFDISQVLLIMWGMVNFPT